MLTMLMSRSVSVLYSIAILLLISMTGSIAFQKAGMLTRIASRHTVAFVGTTTRRRHHHQQQQQQQVVNRPLVALQATEVDPGVVSGTDLSIVKYPHPALRQPNAEVTPEELKDGSMAKLAKEMFLVMYAAEGVGLAAPQVGVNKRLMVYNESGDKKKWLDEVVMVNPKIVEFSDATDVGTEGCLSFPDMSGDVERSKWIKVEAVNLKGKKIKRKYAGWEARIFQHEYDHLDGKVYIDRLTEEGRKEVQPTLDELIQEFGEGGAL